MLMLLEKVLLINTIGGTLVVGGHYEQDGLTMKIIGAIYGSIGKVTRSPLFL